MDDNDLPRRDSPLRRIPPQLEPRQRRFLDGVRLSIEMTSCAHDRLVVGLASLLRGAPATEIPRGAFAAVMLDAWAIVDGIHRLRCLLRQMPGMKKATPHYRLFERETGNVVELRNHVQHLDQELSDTKDPTLPAWGELAWVRVPDESHPEHVTLCAIVPGAIFDRETRMVNPIGRQLRGHVDQIELTAFGLTANLSELFRALQTFAAHLDSGLTKAFAEHDLSPGGSDVLVQLSMVCCPKPEGDVAG
jgi:hypothetical protein